MKNIIMYKIKGANGRYGKIKTVETYLSAKQVRTFLENKHGRKVRADLFGKVFV